LRWRLKWGRHLKAFKQRAKKTGVVAAPLLNQPNLKEQDLEFLRAYDHAAHSRRFGMSAPDPLQVSELQALCSMLGIVSSGDKSKYLRILQKMDRAFLDHWDETHPVKT
jgi:hypothetical protein